MLKVFLVEDEVVVREGIKNNIAWKEEGFEFCGEASDGELAFPMIQQLKPDIIITDIRMPFMDGLELSKLVKQDLPWVKIIILSGHEEFKYAKEAIKIGVTDYLLKPISGAELLVSVKEVAKTIQAEHEEKENMERFRQEMKENEMDARRKLFNDIVGNYQSLTNVLEKGKELNMDLSAPCYNIILFQVYTERDSREAYSGIEVEIQQKLDNLFDNGENVIKFDRNVEGMALLFKAAGIEEIRELQEKYIHYIESIMSEYEGVRYFGGIGAPVQRLRELSDSFMEANRAFAYRYIYDKNQILDYNAISEQQKVEQEVKLGNINVSNMDKKKVDAFLRSGETDEISYFVEEYLRNIGNSSWESVLVRQYIIMDMYFAVISFTEQLGYDKTEIEEPFSDTSQGSMKISNYQQMRDYIIRIFNQAIDFRKTTATKRYSALISRSKDYIDENYANEDLSLNMVAANVNISPSHFSAVFSQETGQTFVRYLTELRMEKAKELLKCTDKKSSEIGYEVGYKDPHYFSYLFKKTQNCTPKQYRNSNGNDADGGAERSTSDSTETEGQGYGKNLTETEAQSYGKDSTETEAQSYRKDSTETEAQSYRKDPSETEEQEYRKDLTENKLGNSWKNSSEKERKKNPGHGIKRSLYDMMEDAEEEKQRIKEALNKKDSSER